MTSSPTDMFTKNKFIDKCFSIIPEDPVKQTLYMYILTIIVFIGLLGFSISSWMVTVISFNGMALGRSVFMTAITFMSLFGLKQTRLAYHTTKAMMSQSNISQPEIKIENVNEMLGEFR